MDNIRVGIYSHKDFQVIKINTRSFLYVTGAVPSHSFFNAHIELILEYAIKLLKYLFQAKLPILKIPFGANSGLKAYLNVPIYYTDITKWVRLYVLTLGGNHTAFSLSEYLF